MLEEKKCYIMRKEFPSITFLKSVSRRLVDERISKLAASITQIYNIETRIINRKADRKELRARVKYS